MSTMWAALAEDPLRALVRVVGVVVGFWGTVMVSPDAARAVWRTTREYVVRQWFRLGALLGFRQHVTVRPSTAVGVGSAHVTVTTTATGSAWSEVPAQQIQILRERTDNLAIGLTKLRDDHDKRFAEVDVELERLRAHHVADIKVLRAQQQERERENLRINARWLPLIAASIILSGLPDPVVSNPWFGWPLLVAAVIVAVAVIRGPNPA